MTLEEECIAAYRSGNFQTTQEYISELKSEIERLNNCLYWVIIC